MTSPGIRPAICILYTLLIRLRKTQFNHAKHLDTHPFIEKLYNTFHLINHFHLYTRFNLLSYEIGA